jgi:hypothetical protein
VALTEPELDLHAFFNSGPNRSTNGLGEIDGALLRWAKLTVKESSTSGRVSPVKFIRNPDHAGNGGANFSAW